MNLSSVIEYSDSLTGTTCIYYRYTYVYGIFIPDGAIVTNICQTTQGNMSNITQMYILSTYPSGTLSCMYKKKYINC